MNNSPHDLLEVLGNLCASSAIEPDSSWDLAMAATKYLDGIGNSDAYCELKHSAESFIIGDISRKMYTPWKRAILGCELMLSQLRMHGEAHVADLLASMINGSTPLPIFLQEEFTTKESRPRLTHSLMQSYTMMVIKRVTCRKGLESIISASIHNLTGSVDKPNIGIDIFSVLLTRGCEANLVLLDIFRVNGLVYLAHLFAQLDGRSSIERELVLKSLILPLILMVANDNHSKIRQMLVILWGFIRAIDLEETSILLCALTNLQHVNALLILVVEEGREVWDLVLRCFLSESSLIRKRAAFVLQRLPRVCDEPSASVPVAKNGCRMKVVEDNQDDESHGVVRINEAESSFALLSPVPTNGFGGQRPWWSDFLDVFMQVENSSSMHLIQQVWPLLQHLCRTVIITSQDLELDLSSRSSLYPTLTFDWVKALLHCLLRAPIPTIRKTALRSLLSCGVRENHNQLLPLSAREDTINWFCGELLPMIDSVNYFSAFFLGRYEDVGCSSEGPIFCQNTAKTISNFGDSSSTSVTETFSLNTKIVNSTMHPGILMPSFLAWLLVELGESVGTNGAGESYPLRALLIRSLVRTVCGDGGSAPTLRSLSAAKWIFRAFSEEAVVRLVPRCLDCADFSAVRAYLRGVLASSNGVVRDHVLQGLLPLVVAAADLRLIRISDIFRLVLSPLGTPHIHATFSLKEFRRVLNDKFLIEQLKNACAVALSTTNEREGAACAVHGCVSDNNGYVSDNNRQHDASSCLHFCTSYEKIEEEMFLAIAVYLMGNHQSSKDPLAAAVRERLNRALRLYDSPYMPVEHQVGAVWFLRGVAWLVLTLPTTGNSTATSTSVTTEITEERQLVFPFLTELAAGADSINGYLSFELKLVLHSFMQSCDAAARAPHRLFDNFEGVDVVMDVMEAMLLLHSSPSSQSHVLSMIETLCSVVQLALKLLSNADENEFVTHDDERGEAGKLFAVRCVRGALCLLNRVIPNLSVELQGQSLAKTSTVVVEAVSVLLLMQTRDPRRPKTTIDTTARPTTSKQHSGIVNDFLKITSGQFGRASALFSSSRWSAIQAALNMTSRVIKLGTGKVEDGIKGQSIVMAGALAACCDTFIDKVMEELTRCPMTALPDVFGSCELVLPLLLPQPTTHLENDLTVDMRGIEVMQRGDVSGAAISETQQAICDLIEAAWVAVLRGSNCNDVAAMNSFIRLVFSAPMLHNLPHHQIMTHFETISSLGKANRPHLLQSLMLQLCGVWRAEPLLSLPFSDVIVPLLLFREPRVDDQNTPDDLDIILAVDGVGSFESTGIVRFSILLFLEALAQEVNTSVKDSAYLRLRVMLEELLLSLIELNHTTEFKSSAMIGSEQFGRKLRCWQALCALSRFIDESLLIRFVDSYFVILTHPCAHSIRVPMEIFGAAVGRRYPSTFLPVLLHQLRQFNHTQQTLCSFFVILGHIFFEPTKASFPLPSSSSSKSSSSAALSSRPICRPQISEYAVVCSVDSDGRLMWSRAVVRDVVDCLVPWLACAAGLPRSVAQMLMHYLIPCVLKPLEGFCVEARATADAEVEIKTGIKVEIDREKQVEAESAKKIRTDTATSTSTDGDTYLKSIFCFLDSNRDASRVIPKQWKFFTEYNPSNYCSVAGITAHTMDAAGEVLPVHLLTILAETLKELKEGDSTEGGGDGQRHCWSEIDKKSQQKGRSNGGNEEDPPSAIPLALQTKHIPFDELQLAVREHTLSRARNAAGRRRQHVIVCASLVQKPTNLAGIARTCEIFAAEQLVLSNIDVTRSEEFRAMAVSCEGWLPMSQVPEHKLSEYLAAMKCRGYRILGLEQTDKSVDLSKISSLSGKEIEEGAGLPSHCVLLLGKEKEGIPATLLQVVDTFLQIPQYGVIRSLNVHVSAALVLWELTKRNKDQLEGI